MRYLAKITTTFALALVFSAGTTFGQDAQVDQYGNDMDADIVQAEDVGNSASIVQGNQEKNFNNFTARIEQLGGDNSATIDQSQAGPGLPTARIFQDGNGNTANQTQFFGGTNNDEELSEISQVGNDNTAMQRQEHFTGDKVEATISQTGNMNYSEQTQIGSGASFEAHLTQEGNSNYAIQVQHDYSSAAAGYESDITQIGTGNDARVYQGTQP